MTVVARVMALLGSLIIAVVAWGPGAADAGDTACEPVLTPIQEPTGGVGVQGFDRDGNTLWYVWGDGALIVRSPDGDWRWLGTSVWGSDTVPSEAAMLPNGTVVSGAYRVGDSLSTLRGALWREGELTLLKKGDVGSARATDANRSGAIVGTSYSGGVVYWADATAQPTLLSATGEYIGYTNASIDRDGVIYAQARPSLQEPLVWLRLQGNRLVEMHFPARFTAQDVAGDFAVGDFTRSDGTRVPALYGPGGLWRMPLPHGVEGKGLTVTARGEWGGYTTDGSGQGQGFVARGTQDLQSLPFGVVDIASFGHTSAVTDGGIYGCLYPEQGAS